MLFYFIGIIV